MTTNILFKFSGDVYRFNIIVMKSVKSYTRAKSKEKAINNIKSQYKKDLGYSNSASLDIIGNLTVIYDINHVEIYDINGSDIILKETCFTEKINTTSNYSLEEIKFNILHPNKYRAIFNQYNTCESIDITNKIQIYNNCISFNESDYLYDENENVYWKDGIPYNDKIKLIEIVEGD